MTHRTRVAMTSETVAGAPYWGPNTVTTDLLPDQTEVAIENLVAGRRYWIKTWNEDQFGNKSKERQTFIDTPTPTRLQPMTFSANGALDEGSPMYAFVKVPAQVVDIQEVKVTLAFRQFFASAQEAASGGSLTADSGGGSTSGSSSAASSSANLTGLTFTSENPAHTHTNPEGGSTGSSGVPPGGTSVLTGVSGTGNHSHPIPHTHSTPDHTHPIAAHDHALVYGTFEEAFPISHSVRLSVWLRVAGVFTMQWLSDPITDTLADVDLTSVITVPGDWRLQVQSEAGQPNGGRLGLDLFGTLIVVV